MSNNELTPCEKGNRSNHGAVVISGTPRRPDSSGDRSEVGRHPATGPSFTVAQVNDATENETVQLELEEQTEQQIPQVTRNVDKRKTWTHERRLELWTCYILADASKAGYQQRLGETWTIRGNPPKSGSALVSQVKYITKNNILTLREREEVANRLTSTDDDTTDNDISQYQNEELQPAPNRVDIEEVTRNHNRQEQERAQQRTARTDGRVKWTLEGRMEIWTCYTLADPTEVGYIKRLRQIWMDRGNPRNISEAALNGQVNQIKKKDLLTTEEKRRSEARARREHDTTNQEGLDGEEAAPHAADLLTPTTANQTEEERHREIELEDADPQPHPPPAVEEETRPTPDEEGTAVILRNKLHLYKEKEYLEPLPVMKTLNPHQLREVTAKINRSLKFVITTNITDTNTLIYAAADLTAEMMRVARRKGNNNHNTHKKDPPWKFRLQKKKELLRKHLSWASEWRRGCLMHPSKRMELDNLYKVTLRGVIPTEEMLKQRLQACSAKLKRFTARTLGYHQNRLFSTNQRRLYSQLKGEDGTQATPDPEQSTEFWKNIWSIEVEHNRDAEWIREIKDNNRVERDTEFQVTLDMMKAQLSKVPNWKAPGPDQIQGYWIKSFSALHGRIASQLQDCVEDEITPGWMTRGRTVLIQKDSSKGNIPSNYRPITCLPVMYKLLTGMINQKVYHHLETKGLLPREQKGGRKGCRGTKDHLLVDKMILRQAKSQKRRLNIAYIDYKKAFDMTPHSWLIECMNIYGISRNIVNLMTYSMQHWRVILTANNSNLGEVQIRRGIFQGDSLSPLLFIMALIPMSETLRKMKEGYTIKRGMSLNHLLFMDDLKLFGSSEEEIRALLQTTYQITQDIGMEFGLDKCGILSMAGGRVIHSEGLEMDDGSWIREIEEQGYKYLGVLEYDDVLHERMKENIRNEYISRVRLILRSHLSSNNSIKAINTWAVPVVRYSAGVVKWKKLEAQKMDTKTRKLLTIYGAHHPKGSVDRLYIERGKGGRGLMSVEECIDRESSALGKYIKDHSDELMRQVWLSGIIKEARDPEEFKTEQQEVRRARWREKPLPGQYLRQMEDIQSKESWNWLRSGDLKRETEGTIVAAQDQALRTRAILHDIEGRNISPKCRMCGDKKETINHIISECPKLAQKEYKRRHDKVATAIHWTLCKRYDLDAADRWYQHVPEVVQENEKVKLIWDFNIQTDLEIGARRPDLVLVHRESNTTYIIDVAIPYDTRIMDKQVEKIQKYQDLRIQIGRCWGTSAKVIPIVMGALGAQPPQLAGYLKDIGCERLYIGTIQKSVLLGTAHIIRKVLGA